MPSTNKAFNKRIWATLPDGTNIPAERRGFTLVTDPTLPKNVEVAHNQAYQRQPDGSLRRVNIIKASTGEFVAIPEEKKHGKGKHKNRIRVS